MSDPKKFAQRRDRSFVTPFEIKGAVIKDGSEIGDVVLIWNISDSGMCIWTESRFKKGDTVTLRIDNPWQVTFECEVRWSRAIPDRSGYVQGVLAVSNQKKLSSIYKELVDQQKKVV